MIKRSHEFLQIIDLPENINYSIDDLKFAVIPDSLKNVTRFSPHIDINKELKRIESTCLPIQDKKYLTGGVLTGSLAKMFNEKLLVISQKAIGFEEVRGVLGVRQPHAKWYCGEAFDDWVKFGWRDQEKAAAKTRQEYYDLIEPMFKLFERHDCGYFFEEQVHKGIVWLDKKMPTVRHIHRQKLEELLLRPNASEVFDKKEVDNLMEERRKTTSLVDGVLMGLFKNKNCCQANENKCEEKEIQNRKDVQ